MFFKNLLIWILMWHQYKKMEKKRLKCIYNKNTKVKPEKGLTVGLCCDRMSVRLRTLKRCKNEKTC